MSFFFNILPSRPFSSIHVTVCKNVRLLKGVSADLSGPAFHGQIIDDCTDVQSPYKRNNMASGGLKKKSGKAGLLEKVLSPKCIIMLVSLLSFILKDYHVIFFSHGTQWAIGSDQPVKIDKWDCNAVKNALDDAAKKVTVYSQ